MVNPPVFVTNLQAIHSDSNCDKTTKGTLFDRAFWARGYCVSTIGLDEETIRAYVRNQGSKSTRTSAILNFILTNRPLLGTFLIPPVLPVITECISAILENVSETTSNILT